MTRTILCSYLEAAKLVNYNLVFIFTLFALYPLGSVAESCDENLTYCRNTLREITDTTYFDKDTNNKQFINWWKRKWIHGRALGIITVDYQLNLVKPDKIGGKYETYTLPGDKNISIILQVPIAKPSQKNPFGCVSNKANLKSSKNERGLLIDLNPYCSETYGPDEVTITLYWISIYDRPLVEISTNGPACVPAMLYVYNKEKSKYILATEKCGG